MKSEDYLAGMREAAEIVGKDWNDSMTMTNQKMQAERSRRAIIERVLEYSDERAKRESPLACVEEEAEKERRKVDRVEV